tara:strand:+ start:4110 stop:5495 length:1386 start_codon:yes stop_codon:yes gene_type:complete
MSEFDPTKKSHDADAMAPYLETVDDVVNGIEAMRENFARYVPKFPKERPARYELRRKLSKMTNVFRDVLEGLASKPFSREVQVMEPQGGAGDLIEDIDGRDNHLSVFAGSVFFQAIADSITWIRVDYPAGQTFRNREEERAAGVRPYWVHVNHKDILEIRSERQAGGERITYMRMYEDHDKILELTPDEWKRWDKIEGEWKEGEDGRITIGMVPMVPVITGRRKGKSWQFYPPMRDALDAQVELFNQQCALKFAETMTCFPILSANGVDPATDAEGNPLPLEIGPDAVLYAPPNSEGQHGSWERVEPTTASLKHLAEGIDSQIKEIRELGRQPLTAQSGNLTRISAAAATSKGNSAVQQWAGALKDALENALMITNLWLNDSTEPEVDVFTEFRATDEDGNTLQHLREMRANGDLSRQTLWDESKRLGQLSDNFDPEEETQRILEELPSGGTPLDMQDDLQ